MKKKIFSLLALLMVTMSMSAIQTGKFDLSVGTTEHGTITFSYGEGASLVENATEADEGVEVTMTVAPDAGWMVDASKVIAELSTSWEMAGARRTANDDIGIQSTVTLTHKSTNTATGARTYTFTMPASSLKASAGYIPIAAFATEGTAPDVKTLVPTAAEGVYVGEQKAIVVAGTVAKIGTTENAQGTVKYFATLDATMTAVQALAADGWVSTLPTAEAYTGEYTDALKVYVWYYIAAADGYANSAPARLEVTLLKNMYTLNFDPTPVDKITVKVNDADKTVTDGKAGVKMGSNVTLAASAGYVVTAIAVTSGDNNVTVNTTDGVSTFTMPGADATATYTAKRDMAVSVTAQLGDGTDGYRIRIQKKNGKFETLDPFDLVPAVSDNIGSEAKQMFMGTDFTITSVQVLDGSDWVATEDIGVGTYRIAITGAGDYDGITYTNTVQLYQGYEVTIPADEFITYYKDEALTVEAGSGAELYTITSFSETTATLSGPYDAMKKNTPMLVYNNSGADKTFLLIPCDEPDLALTVAPEFVGTLTATTIAASTAAQSNYALNGKQFVWVKNAINVGANKCWLSISTPSSARTISLVFGDAMAASAIVPPAYKITVGTNDHGTFAFKVNDVAAPPNGDGEIGVNKNDAITLTITADADWAVDKPSGVWYTAEAKARLQRRSQADIDMVQDFDLTYVSTDATTGAVTFSFTMIAANAEMGCSYKKKLQAAWIQPIADMTFTGSPLTPTVTVIDGETTLVEGTDYTVSYSNNINAAAADAENAPTVTITAVSTSEKYTGTATATFTINPRVTEEGGIEYSEGGDYVGVVINETGNQEIDPLPEDMHVSNLTYRRHLEEGDEAYTICLPGGAPTASYLHYYTLTGVDEGTLYFDEIEGEPENYTPYLVVTDKSTTVSLPNMKDVVMIKGVNSFSSAGDYVMKGTISGIKHEDAIGLYILQSGNRWGVIVPDKTEAYIPPCRAYIEATTAAARKTLNSTFNNNTAGIQNIRAVDRDGTERWFDLNGRRIEKPATKGIYIQNGHKVVIK